MLLILDENCGSDDDDDDDDDAWRFETPNDATDLTINVGWIY